VLERGKPTRVGKNVLGFFIFRVGLVTGHKQATVKNRVGFRRSQHEMLKIPTRFFFRVGEPNTISRFVTVASLWPVTKPTRKIKNPNTFFSTCHF
jgi:hypothetical protein